MQRRPAAIHYYLKSAGGVAIVISDSKDEEVARLEMEGHAGLNTASWNLSKGTILAGAKEAAGEREADEEKEKEEKEYAGRGKYKVVLVAGGKEYPFEKGIEIGGR